MQTYQVSFSQNVNIADIEAALSLVGEFKLTVARQVKPRTAKVAAELQEPLAVYRDGEVIRELNPCEVEQGMRKIQAEYAARMRADGRSKCMFPTYREGRDTVAAYVQAFCCTLQHVKSTYQLGADQVRA